MKLSKRSFAFFTHPGMMTILSILVFPLIQLSGLFVLILYKSGCSYEEETMKKYVLHLLILSHSYSVPSLKRVCTHYLEYRWLTKENVVDVLQLARYCDAPRLSLFCIRMVLKDFKSISLTEGWKVMKRANPALEQEILEAVVEVDSVSLFCSFLGVAFAVSQM